MFGPKTPETLILQKTKLWWESLNKIHLPEQRAMLSSSELVELSKQMQRLEVEIRCLQLNIKTPINKMIDFQKLRRIFYRKEKYHYGVPIKLKEVKVKKDETNKD